MQEIENPCRNCPIHKFDCDKLNHIDCIKCPARVDYVSYLSNPDVALNVVRRGQTQQIRAPKDVNANRPKAYTAWSTEELSYLRRNYGRRSNKEIAEALGRNINGIDRVASNHGIRYLEAETPEAKKRERNRAYMKAYRAKAAAIAKGEEYTGPEPSKYRDGNGAGAWN